MTKPKQNVQVLPSKQDEMMDKLADAVLQRLAKREANKPETDEELSESVLLQPWMLPRDVATAIRNLLPVTHWWKWDGVYEQYGCFRCERKDVPHQSLGLCGGCYGMLQSRAKAEIVKNIERRSGQPTAAQMKAQLTQKQDSPRKILTDMGIARPALPATTKHRAAHEEIEEQ